MYASIYIYIYIYVSLLNLKLFVRLIKFWKIFKKKKSCVYKMKEFLYLCLIWKKNANNCNENMRVKQTHSFFFLCFIFFMLFSSELISI